MDSVALFTIVGVIALGAISPGPSFIVVARTALAAGPGEGRLAAVGIGAASLVFSVIAVTGLGVALVYAGWLFTVLKVAGGIYLVYLGVRMWLARRTGAPVEAGEMRVGSRRAFLSAMLTHLSNPKTIVVYGSIFATALPHDASVATLVAVPLGVTLVESAWYLIVATVLSRTGPQRVYARSVGVVDRVAGTFLGGLGAYFAVDGIRTAVR
ncbi:LysE family translocator [Promicromonospora sp. NPDC019610]|uniref:LysE family translocator n=1 Tax=Promicromonospora sp. NPDC019610 TaxID=3364405 RepID=UPI0037BB64B9